MAGALLNSAIPFLTATDRRQCVLMVCTYYTFAYAHLRKVSAPSTTINDMHKS